MAADSSESSGSADSYIGCFISLISKAEIRYEGSMFHINPQESTIGLRNVKSFGTEGRRKDGPQVLPSDKVYDYIFFQGSDIKDLQVLSSPPVQFSPDVPNDPAIIQHHYPCSSSASPTFPSASAVPATETSSSAQLGLPNSTLPRTLPVNQPVGSLGSWDSFSPPTANGHGIAVPNHWLEHNGSSGRVSHLQQQSLPRPPQDLPVSHPVQQQMQNPTVNASLPSDTSKFAQLSRPMFPTVGTGSPNLTSTMPPPSALTSSSPIRQSATLSSELSCNLMPSTASNALPTVTMRSFSQLASPLTASSLDVNPISPPSTDRPKSVNQTISQSTPSIGGSSSQFHSEASMPSPLTPGGLLQPGLRGQSSRHLQTAHKDIEVVQASPLLSMSSDLKSSENSSQLLPSPSAGKLNKAALRTHHSERECTRAKGNWLKEADLCSYESYKVQARGGANRLNGAALHSHHPNKGQARERGNILNKAALHANHSERECTRGKGNRLKGADLCSHHSYRVQARGRANRLNGAALRPHESNRGHFGGRENGPNTAAVRTCRSYRGCGRERGNQNTTGIYTHRSDRGPGQGKGSQVFSTKATMANFTEDFYFEAMNEKFNKEEIWGHLGKSKKISLQDEEEEENDNDANESENKFKPFYVKDDFFDSLSCNSPNHESGRGRAKLSEQRRIDIETFGETPRHRRGRNSRSRGRGRGRGENSGGSHGSGGRGNGYGGTGPGRTVWSCVT